MNESIRKIISLMKALAHIGSKAREAVEATASAMQRNEANDMSQCLHQKKCFSDRFIGAGR